MRSLISVFKIQERGEKYLSPYLFPGICKTGSICMHFTGTVTDHFLLGDMLVVEVCCIVGSGNMKHNLMAVMEKQPLKCKDLKFTSLYICIFY